MGIKKRKSKKGFTVIEAIISLVLFTLIMIPLGSFTLTAVKTSVKSATKEQAINAGQGALEQLKTIKLSQLNKIDLDSNYSESDKATLKLGNLNVIKTKDNPIYKVDGEYIDPNNKKKFNIDGEITQGNLDVNGKENTEHHFDDGDFKKNYVVYIGENLITVYKIVSKDNIIKKYIDNNTIKIIEDKDNDSEEAKIVSGEFSGSSIDLEKWLLIKNRTIRNNLNEITTLFIDENNNGEINIKAENEDKGEEIATPESTIDERKMLVKILAKYTDDYYTNDSSDKLNKESNIKVRFYEDAINKEINLKISNKCLGSKLNVYTYKNKGSGVRYNIYTSTENSHGDISVFKNYIEGNSEDLRGQLFNINLKVKEKDEVLYNLNTTEFIGG